MKSSDDRGRIVYPANLNESVFQHEPNRVPIMAHEPENPNTITFVNDKPRIVFLDGKDFAYVLSSDTVEEIPGDYNQAILKALLALANKRYGEPASGSPVWNPPLTSPASPGPWPGTVFCNITSEPPTPGAEPKR